MSYETRPLHRLQFKYWIVRVPFQGILLFLQIYRVHDSEEWQTKARGGIFGAAWILFENLKHFLEIKLKTEIEVHLF